MVQKSSIDDKIKLAISLCDGDISNFYQFNYIYPFATENISGYIDKFDLSGKSLLTVGSSGDQALNAILRGCQDVTVYDICPFAKEYFYLKQALIMSLTRDAYLKFLCYKNYPSWPLRNRSAFDVRVFDRIYEHLVYLDLESSYFWSELFANFSGREIRQHLFNNVDEQNSQVIKLINRYLVSDQSFNALRDKLEMAKIKFVQGDIANVESTSKFDSIYLSNVAAYLDLDMFKKCFLDCTELLKDNGKLLVCYLYDTDFDEGIPDNKNNIYNIELIRRLLDSEIAYDSFVGINGLSVADKRMTDSILTYKKVKKI